MNRLTSEQRRLYLVDAPEPALIGPAGEVRAMVLELVDPPSWALLSRVWLGVQNLLDLPAPAIAVSGTDGLQLWFSLDQPVPAAQAQAFVRALWRHFLPEVEARCVRLLPATEPAPHHAALVPAEQGASGNWSAFVAQDLAPVFSDTPWLDIPPGAEGQANLLGGLETITPAAFAAAMAQLAPAVPATGTSATAPLAAAAEPADDAPRHFLLRVMHDDSVPMALRIEAAKALLQHPG